MISLKILFLFIFYLEFPKDVLGLFRSGSIYCTHTLLVKVAQLFRSHSPPPPLRFVYAPKQFQEYFTFSSCFKITINKIFDYIDLSRHKLIYTYCKLIPKLLLHKLSDTSDNQICWNTTLTFI